MKDTSLDRQSSSAKWIKYFLIFLIVIGIIFRFVNIEGKVYWIDEVYTSLRSSGTTEIEVVQNLREKEIVSAGELLKYQYNTNDKTSGNVIYSLATEDPHHPPLYFLMSKEWVHWLGNTVFARRSLSAVLSLLALPLMYWLCLELFNSYLAGLVGTAVISLSPFHILYSQEARQYSLWTVTILFSSACLLLALRKKSSFVWLLYSVSLALSLYTFLYSFFVAFSHAIYVLVTENIKTSKSFIKYLKASTLSILFFVPWLWVVANSTSHINKITGGTKYSINNINLQVLITYFKEILVNLSRISVDIITDSGASNNLFSPLTISLITIVCLSIAFYIYSIYFTWIKTRNSQIKAWVLIVSLISVNYFFVFSIDLLLGKDRAMISRLFTPAYIAIQLAISYFISEILNYDYFNLWQNKIRTFSVSMLLFLALVSGINNSQAQTSWIKSYGLYNHLAAKEINKSPNPIVVSTDLMGASDSLSLSNYLRPDVMIFAQPICYTCSKEFVNNNTNISAKISIMFDGFSDVFLFNLYDQKLVEELNKKFELIPVILPETRTGKGFGSNLVKLKRL